MHVATSDTSMPLHEKLREAIDKVSVAGGGAAVDADKAEIEQRVVARRRYLPNMGVPPPPNMGTPAPRWWRGAATPAPTRRSAACCSARCTCHDRGPATVSHRCILCGCRYRYDHFCAKDKEHIADLYDPDVVVMMSDAFEAEAPSMKELARPRSSSRVI